MVQRSRSAGPRTVGNYAIGEKIAEGGMGAVYRGTDQATGEVVAIKVLASSRAENPAQLKRFEQEFRAALRLDHPNIVKVLDFGFEGSTHYLVMELVDGPSLGDRIERDGRLPEAEAIAIIVQAAEALHHAHLQGLVHRDVKPDNILLTSDGRAKLADLGLVKQMDKGIDLTRPNTGLGTPNFMAPEQFNDAKHADPRCDIYSLGATLYMAVTGVLPFAARTALNVLKKKMRGDLALPRQVVPTLSERTDLVIRQAMSGDPRQRQANCPEFIAALTGKAGEPVSDRKLRIADLKATLQPPGDVARYRGKERRTMLRHPSGQEGSCVPLACEKDLRWTARVKDISNSGISLVVSRRFEVGTVLVVQLRDREEGFPHFLMVRVVRNQPQPPRKWLLGCIFARPLSKDEMIVLT